MTSMLSAVLLLMFSFGSAKLLQTNLGAGKLVQKKPLQLYPFNYSFIDSLKGSVFILNKLWTKDEFYTRNFSNKNYDKYKEREMTVLSVKTLVKSQNNKNDLNPFQSPGNYVILFEMNDTHDTLQLDVSPDDFYYFLYSVSDLKKARERWIGKKMWTNGAYWLICSPNCKDIIPLFEPITISKIMFSDPIIFIPTQFVFFGITEKGDTLQIPCSIIKVGTPRLGIDFSFGLSLLENPPEQVWDVQPKSIDQLLGFKISVSLSSYIKQMKSRGAIVENTIASYKSHNDDTLNRFSGYNIFNLKKLKINGLGPYNGSIVYDGNLLHEINLSIGSGEDGAKYDLILKQFIKRFGKPTDHFSEMNANSQKTIGMDVWAFYSPAQKSGQAIVLKYNYGGINLFILQ